MLKGRRGRGLKTRNSLVRSTTLFSLKKVRTNVDTKRRVGNRKAALPLEFWQNLPVEFTDSVGKLSTYVDIFRYFIQIININLKSFFPVSVLSLIPEKFSQTVDKFHR